MRAWDALVSTSDEECRIEAETALQDLQATDRRVVLKMEDDHINVVVLLVADTQRNRAALREFRSLLVDRYPLDTHAVMQTLRKGRIPSQSGVAIL